jgi:hypothetical protein
MKWKDLPLLLKVLIIVLIGFIISKFLQGQHRQKLYDKWLDIQKEIKNLLSEKQNILKLIYKAKKYADLTLKALKITLILLFFVVVYHLKENYTMDIFSAIGSTAGTISVMYIIISIIMKNRIADLNELLNSINVKIENIYKRRLKISPDRLDIIELRLSKLNEESSNLKKMLK